MIKMRTYNSRKVVPDVISALAKHRVPPAFIERVAKDVLENIMFNPEIYVLALYRAEDEETLEKESDEVT